MLSFTCHSFVDLHYQSLGMLLYLSAMEGDWKKSKSMSQERKCSSWDTRGEQQALQPAACRFPALEVDGELRKWNLWHNKTRNVLAGEKSHGTKMLKALKKTDQDYEDGLWRARLLSAKKIHFSRTPSKYRCKMKIKTKKATFRLLKSVKLMNEFEFLALLFP